MEIKYRPELDGLRTVAVLSVIIYHAEFMIEGRQLLPGGFLGVDIFFVISGFLITSILMKEFHRTGTISISSFYERRARRLLPVLVVVMLASLPFAWIYLLPEQLVDYAKSLITSLFFGSNFYWSQSLQQYGAESTLFKPFIHTWSLAVEEQFYIFYPLTLLAILKWQQSHMLGLLTAGLIASLLFSEWMTFKDTSFSFYLLPSRLWELLAGSLLVNMSVYNQINRFSFFKKCMPSLGLCLILYSIIFLDLKSIKHPGFITLIPVAGTMLIIFFSQKDQIIIKMLSSKPFVSIGLISYSLYLWHYPALALLRIDNIYPSLFQKFITLLFITVISLITYFFVEIKFRINVSKKTFITLCVTFYIIISIFSFIIIYFDGFRSRQSVLIEMYGINEFDNQVLKEKSNKIARIIAEKNGSVGWRLDEKERLWFTESKSTKKILIIGNSHAKNIYNSFYLNPNLFSGYEFAKFRIQIDSSSEEREALYNSPNFIKSEVVLISTAYSREDLLHLPEFIDNLIGNGKIVWISNNSPEFESYGFNTIADEFIKKAKGIIYPIEINREYYKKQLNYVNDTNEVLKNISQNKNIPLLDKNLYSCNQIDMTCTGVTLKGYKAYFDGEHYTIEGAKYFGTVMDKIKWLSQGEVNVNVEVDYQ